MLGEAWPETRSTVSAPFKLRFHVDAERAFSGKVAEVLQVREVRVEPLQHVQLNVLFELGDGRPDAEPVRS
jgi:hypothetical protein